MNPRATWFWTGVAAAMFAFIFFVERSLHKPPEGPLKVLPGFQPAAVTSVQVLPKGQLEIRAERTNGLWQLALPFNYPAQGLSIEALLAALQQLTPATFIPAQELKNIRQADKKYGFEPPQTTVVLGQGDEQSFIHIGYRTAPGDQVFVQVVGIGEVYVVDADLLQLIPDKADAWRDTRLVDLKRFTFDRLMVTNAGKVFELQWNPTNKLWRMILPGWEPRADSDKVEEALHRLYGLRVEQFVSDDPKADLESFGLQAPDFSLALEQGTNLALLLEFGKSPTNNPGQLFARRGGQNTVVTVAKDSLAPWRASYEVFRDRHLVTLTGLPDLIEIQAQDSFSLQRQTNRNWRVVPQSLPGGFPADPALVDDFFASLTNLQVTGFPKDVVTTPDLPAWGLDTPTRRFALKTAATNAVTGPTNILIAQLDFGTNQDDKIFARRADESSIYTIKLADLQRLPVASWQMRDRQIWKFAEEDVARLLIHQDGKTREIIRKGPKSWSLAPGSQGIINDLALDEATHRLGDLAAAVWVDHGELDNARYGFSADDYRLSVELKNGQKLNVEIGGTAASGFPYAMTVLDGQPWVYEFPWGLYQFVQMYLTIPAYIH